MSERVTFQPHLAAEQRNIPLLFHCAAGKDRTGILAAVILKSLGVGDEIICADYVLTERLNPEWRVSRDNRASAYTVRNRLTTLQ